jgi:hypothetical protein
MNFRKAFAGVLGLLQSFLALVLFALACILYFNFFDAQALLNSATSYLPVHLAVLVTYGFVSFVNGVFLLHEWWESR